MIPSSTKTISKALFRITNAFAPSLLMHALILAAKNRNTLSALTNFSGQTSFAQMLLPKSITKT